MTPPDSEGGHDPAPAPDPRPAPPPLGLFEGFGVEIEWMIVDTASLDVRPVGDRVLGEDGEVDRGTMAWSNELVLHVLEVKTQGPASTLDGLAGAFHAEVLEAERRLAPHGCRLLSGAVHPWMDPDRETRIWPHEYTEVYHAFDRVFGVRGHGWANLQSTHLNLPFSGDAEFAALHQAIRLMLPLVPALAAASPVLDGVVQPNLDERMERYRVNSRRIPSVAGGVVPRVVRSRREYEGELLQEIYEDLAPHDPSGTLRHEWVNARGAIARFQRGAVELRVIDAQEAPALDLAVLWLVVEAVRRMVRVGLDGVDGGSKGGAAAGALELPATRALQDLLTDTVRDAERAPLLGPGSARRPGGGRARAEALAPILAALGVEDARPRDAGELWMAVAQGMEAGPEARGLVTSLLGQGPLARRLLRSLARRMGVDGRELGPGEAVPRHVLRDTWEEVAGALRENRAFVP